MRRVMIALTLSLLCVMPVGSGLAQTPIRTSVDAKCEDDATCVELFTGYVKQALESSPTHVFEKDGRAARLRIVLSIAKHSEGGELRGYAFAVIAFKVTAHGQVELAKLSNKYRSTDEVESGVRREIVEYVLK